MPTTPILTWTIRLAGAAAIALTIAGLLVAAANSSDRREATGTIFVEARQVDDFGARSSALTCVAFRIEPVEGDADPIVGRTIPTGPAHTQVAPGEYWVVVERTELDGVPCAGGDRVSVEVADGTVASVAAFSVTSAPLGLDPVCMAAVEFSSLDVLESCVTGLDGDLLDTPCAQESGLRSADELLPVD